MPYFTNRGITPLPVGGGGGGGTVLFDFAGFSRLSLAAGTSENLDGSVVSHWPDRTSGGFVAPSLFTVGGGSNGTTDRALVVALIFPNEASGTVSSPSATYDGSPLTAIGGPYTTTGNGAFWLFGMVAPALGQKILAASWTGSAKLQVAALSVVGALQTGGATTFHGPVSATGNSGTASVTITSALSNEISFACYLTASNLSTFSHTGIGIDPTSAAISTTGAQYTTGAAPVMTGVLGSSNWVAAGVAIAGA